jgi:hypothetical protein
MDQSAIQEFLYYFLVASLFYCGLIYIYVYTLLNGTRMCRDQRSVLTTYRSVTVRLANILVPYTYKNATYGCQTPTFVKKNASLVFRNDHSGWTYKTGNRRFDTYVYFDVLSLNDALELHV